MVRHDVAATLAATSASAQTPRQSAPQMQRGPAAPQMQGQPASPQAQQQPAPAQGRMTSADFRTACNHTGAGNSIHARAKFGPPRTEHVIGGRTTVGRWAYTDDWGWYWISDAAEASWGWVTYHYGRCPRVGAMAPWRSLRRLGAAAAG
jgi:hypothetical protein